MNDQRSTDPHLEEIKETLKEHKYVIERNRSDLEEINKSISSLHESVTPIIEVMEDIAAVGRFGNRIKKFGVFIGSMLGVITLIGASIVAGYEWFQHIGTNK